MPVLWIGVAVREWDAGGDARGGRSGGEERVDGNSRRPGVLHAGEAVGNRRRGWWPPMLRAVVWLRGEGWCRQWDAGEGAAGRLAKGMVKPPLCVETRETWESCRL